MANSFYNVGGVPGNKAPLSSSVIRTEFANIAAGFDKMPTLAGHGDELVKINSGGTGVTSITFTALLATITSLAIAGALTGVTDLTTSGNTILGNAVGDTLNVANGSLQVAASGKVGVGGAAIGAFDVAGGGETVLRVRSTAVANARINLQNSSSGTTDGDGFLLQLSSPDAYVWNYENGPILFGTNATEHLRLAASGQVVQGGVIGTYWNQMQFDGSAYNGLLINDTVAGGAPILLNIVKNSVSVLNVTSAGALNALSLGIVGTASAALFSGSGASLTALNGSNVATGTVANARTTAASANTANAIVARDASGNFNAGAVSLTSAGATGTLTLTDTGVSGVNIVMTGNGGSTPKKYLRVFSGSFEVVNDAYSAVIFGVSDAGAVSATSFAGAGAGLTTLNASNLSSGTVALARLPTTIGDAQIDAAAAIAWTKLSKAGSSLADLATRSATDLTSGTVALARLPTTIGNAQIDAAAAIAWTKLDKTGSSLADLTTRSAADLSSGTLAAARIGAGTAYDISAATVNSYLVGYRGMPASATTAGDAALTDRGKMFYASGTINIPNATFALGDAFSITNDTAGNISITTALATALRWGTNTGARTLAARQTCTVHFKSSTEAYIVGSGLS